LRADHAWDEHLLAASFEFNGHRRHYEQSLTTTQAYIAKADELTVWMQDEWSLSPGLVVTGGLRDERVRLENEGQAHDYHRLSPSIAMRWEPSKAWVLRSSLGAGLKTPKLEELSNVQVINLSANSPLEAVRRGNPDLRPERTLNFEAVLEHYLPGKAGVLGANLYWRTTDDFIERRIALEGSSWVDRPYNVGDATHYGLELDAKLKTEAWGAKDGTLSAHLTLPKSRVEDAALGLTRPAQESPTYQFNLGYDQGLPAWKASAGFQAQFYGRSKTDLSGQKRSATEARAVLDLYATRKLTANFNLRLNAQNVLGTDTRRHDLAWSGAESYRLDTTSRGLTNLLLSLEGKW
jgi:iron complex outermembrane receptor protein